MLKQNYLVELLIYVSLLSFDDISPFDNPEFPAVLIYNKSWNSIPYKISFYHKHIPLYITLKKK
tara:strand:+ start:346 stop:537 length:192 start_codon:yes stop_codon:yes gene_type:complete